MQEPIRGTATTVALLALSGTPHDDGDTYLPGMVHALRHSGERLRQALAGDDVTPPLTVVADHEREELA